MAITLEQLEKRLNSLERAFLQAQRNQVSVTAKTDENAGKIVDLEPSYTETKTGYIDDTEVIFKDVPVGYITITFDRPSIEYTAVRIDGNVVVTFSPLEEVTQVTITIP